MSFLPAAKKILGIRPYFFMMWCLDKPEDNTTFTFIFDVTKENGLIFGMYSLGIFTGFSASVNEVLRV
jgi:hypothetical protein